eukprot:gene3090-biopygen1401
MSRGGCSRPESRWNRSCQSRAKRGIGMSGKQTGRVISRCGKGGVRLCSTKCWHIGWRSAGLAAPIQLDSGDMSSVDTTVSILVLHCRLPRCPIAYSEAPSRSS